VYARDFQEFKIPLPPIDVQNAIVKELNSYQKIIDGCNQVISNYKPIIDIDPSWQRVELIEKSEIVSGYSFDSDNFNLEGGVKVIKIANVGLDEFNETADFLPIEYATQYERFKAKTGDIVMALTRPIIDGGIKVCLVPPSYDGALVNQRVALIKADIEIISYIKLLLLSNEFISYVEEKSRSLMQPNLSINDLKTFKIPFPPTDSLLSIVSREQELLALINGNSELVEIYSRKIKDRISQIWR
jgi:restriction endonuclease S subunit